MPGKVNPVIIESLTMVVARVVGNDATIAFAQTGSLLELNVMLPVTAVALLESIELLAAAATNFADRTVGGLTATDRGPALVEQGLMLATALAPVIGYDEAADAGQGGVQERAHDPRAGARTRHGGRGPRPAARPGGHDRARPRQRSRRRVIRLVAADEPVGARRPRPRPKPHRPRPRPPATATSMAPPGQEQALGRRMVTGSRPDQPDDDGPIAATAPVAPVMAPYGPPRAAMTSAPIQTTYPTIARTSAAVVPGGASNPDPRLVWMSVRKAATAARPPSGRVSSRKPGQSGISGWTALASPAATQATPQTNAAATGGAGGVNGCTCASNAPRRRSRACPTGQRSRVEHGEELFLVAGAPIARIEPKPPASSYPLGSSSQAHPFSTSGGITPGIPRATGSGPSVIVRLSTNSTPSLSTRTANRSMLRGAGP